MCAENFKRTFDQSVEYQLYLSPVSSLVALQDYFVKEHANSQQKALLQRLETQLVRTPTQREIDTQRSILESTQIQAQMVPREQCTRILNTVSSCLVDLFADNAKRVEDASTRLHFIGFQVQRL